MTRKKHFTELVEFQLTPLDKIRYTDADVQYLRRQADVAGDHLIDGTCWTRDGLLAIATCYPVLIRRSKASPGLYEVIANAALLPALRLRHPEISEIPTLVCRGASTQDKRLLAGSELLGLSALFRHREKQVEAMAAMWLAMRAAGVNPMTGGLQVTLERACRVNSRTAAAALSAVPNQLRLNAMAPSPAERQP
jgi:hypothetical protein